MNKAVSMPGRLDDQNPNRFSMKETYYGGVRQLTHLVMSALGCELDIGQRLLRDEPS